MTAIPARRFDARSRNLISRRSLVEWIARLAPNSSRYISSPSRRRQLEIWPLAWRLVRGRAICDTAELFAVAQTKLDAAPALPSIRRRMLDAIAA